MDFIPEPLRTHLPALRSLVSFPWAARLSSFRTTYAESYLIQPLASLLASSTPDLVSIFLLVAILLLSLKILDYARRVIFFWVAMAVKVVFWVAVLAGSYWLYQVGVKKAVVDLVWLWGVLQGFIEGTKEEIQKERRWRS